MQLKIKSRKRILYSLCFLFFCIIDQRTKTGSGLDGIIESFKAATGIVVAVMIFSHYKWEEFGKRKLPYLVWTILGLVGCIAGFIWGMGNRPFLNEWIVILVNVMLWGYIIIHTVIHVMLEKQYPCLNRKLLVIWAVMMILMIVSRSDYLWPFCYAVMFGCLYLTGFSKEEQEDLLQECQNGIILSFILFQAYCFVFRPYDVIRYIGIHNNSNLNALYYLGVLAAVFSKILYVTKQNVAKWMRILYWLLAGAVLAFLFMTIGRIAWITAFVMGLVFLGSLNVVRQKKQLVRNGLLLVLCALLMFPICFGTARYLPPVFHHPVWFWGEWADEKVHSWDAWDSEKYVDLDELLEGALGRIVETIDNMMQYAGIGTEIRYVQAAEEVEEAIVQTVEEVGQEAVEIPYAEVTIDPEDPRIKAAVLDEDIYRNDSLMIRKTIYQYYITHLNWRGHPYEEQGFQLFPEYWIGHAHNIYLQYGTDFGIPVMALFGIMVIWSGAVCWKRGRKNASVADMAALLYILVPALFGLFECAWGVGSLSITMLFLAWGQAMREEEKVPLVKTIK